MFFRLNIKRLNLSPKMQFLHRRLLAVKNAFSLEGSVGSPALWFQTKRPPACTALCLAAVILLFPCKRGAAWKNPRLLLKSAVGTMRK